jgi:CheY-like chemotaxis protein
MKDKYKKKDELVRELAETRERLAEWAAKASDFEGAEERASRLNALLRTTRNVRQIAATETDRESLLQGACEEIIHSEGFHSAWAAVLDDSGRLVSAAEAGLDEAFLPLLEYLEEGALWGCCQRALTESHAVTVENPAASCAECPLSGTYWGTGAIARRLEHLDRVHGLLTVSADAPLIKRNEVFDFLDDIADTLAHALHGLAQKEESNRDIEALKRSKWQLEVKNRVANAVLTAANDGVFRNIVEVLLEATASKVGLLGYMDANGALVVPLMTSDTSDESRAFPQFQIFPEDTWGDTAGARALREKQTVFSNDPCNDSGLSQHHIRRHISQPVVYREEVIGLLQVANKDTDYEQEDVDLLQGISCFLAPALAVLARDTARRQAEESLREANRELETWAHEATSELERVSRSLEEATSERARAERESARHGTLIEAVDELLDRASACTSREQLAHMCLTIAQELTGSRFGYLGQVNASGHLDVVASSRPEEEVRADARSDSPTEIRDVEIRGIWARFVREGRPEIANELVHAPVQAEGLPSLTSFVAVPLRESGGIIGTIVLANSPSAYDEIDQRALETLGRVFVEALARKQAEGSLLAAEQRHVYQKKLSILKQLCEQEGSDFPSGARAVSSGRPFWRERLRQLVSFVPTRTKQSSKQGLAPYDSTHVVLVVGQPSSFPETIRWIMCCPEKKAVLAADEDGEAMLTTARSLKPTVIVVHLNEAGMRRYHTMYQLREEFPDAKIIAASPLNTKSIKFAAREAGADELVLGSNVDRDLLAALRRALSRHD